MNDDEIINLFLKRDENGIIELSTKYHPYCYKIAWNLLANREDAEECLNDTWFSVWSQIPPTHPPVLAHFCGRITRNLSIDRLRKKFAGKRPDVLLRSGNQVWHVEVEHSRKSQRDYAALLAWLTKVLKDKMRPDGGQLLGVGLSWAKVVFICTPAFQTKLCRDLAAAGWTAAHISLLLWFETALYSFADILFP